MFNKILNSEMLLFLIFIFIFSIFSLINNSYVVVQMYQQGFITRFGRKTKNISNGINLLIPYLDKVVIFNKEEVFLKIDQQHVILNDNANIKVDAILFYKIINPDLVYVEIQNLQNSLIALISSILRSVLGTLSLDEILGNRVLINNNLLNSVGCVTKGWGVKVTRIELCDVVPPINITEFMSKQIAAERQKRATITEAEAYKAKKTIEAQVIETLALAQSKSAKLIAEIIKEFGRDAVDFLLKEKYIKAMSKFSDSPNTKLVYIPGDYNSIHQILKEHGTGVNLKNGILASEDLNKTDQDIIKKKINKKSVKTKTNTNIDSNNKDLNTNN